jgi:hypothetical protein
MFSFVIMYEELKGITYETLLKLCCGHPCYIASNERLINNELERMWKEVVMSHDLTWHLTRGNLQKTCQGSWSPA